MKKIAKTFIKSEYNRVPYALGQTLTSVKKPQKDRWIKIQQELKTMKQYNTNHIQTNFLVNLEDMIERETHKSLLTVTPRDTYNTEILQTVIPKETPEETFQKLNQKSENLLCYHSDDVNTPNVLQPIEDLGKEDMDALYHLDETFHITYMDPSVLKSEFQYVDSEEENDTLKYGSRYYYIDRNNIKSFIRPLLDPNQTLRFGKRVLSLKDVQAVYDKVAKDKGIPKDEATTGIWSGALSAVTFFTGKVIITRTKRINLSAGLIQIQSRDSFHKDYIKKRLLKCPILRSYLKEGYVVIEEELKSILKQIQRQLRESREDIPLEDLNKGFLGGNFSQYDAIHTGPNLDYGLDYKVPHSYRKNYSITLVKVDYVDVKKCKLDQEGTLYLPDHDIVLGSMSTKFENEEYSLLENAIHPYSKVALERERTATEVINPTSQSFHYIVDNLQASKPLFVYNYGKVKTVYPKKDSTLDSGFYIYEDKEYRKIPEADFIKYQIFPSEEEASHHHDYLHDSLAADKHREDIYKYKKSELEMKKLEKAWEHYQRETEDNRVIEKRKHELEIRKLSLQKKEVEQGFFTSVLKFVKDIVTPVCALITTGFGIFSLLAKLGGAK